jgi:6-pyruvoyltetrahydropterin/6-carboxytetrahydropterin synthase
LDEVGRILDFSVIKEYLCEWLENNWDHKMLIFKEDSWGPAIKKVDKTVVITEFNPTAENMAEHLLTVVGPAVLWDTGATLIKVTVQETVKCGATVEF